MTIQAKRPAAIRVVIPFVFRHWLNQPGMTLLSPSAYSGQQWPTCSCRSSRPSGRCADRGAEDPDARRAAISAFAAIVALGFTSIVLRMIGLQAIVPFTLKIMSDVARDAFMRCSASRPTGTPTVLRARPCAR